MALDVEIRKKLGNFQLEVQFSAGSEILALLGASGCGKSVTLKCIAGILTPDEGRIVLDGKVLFDSARRVNLPPQRRQVGYLFQQYALFPHMSVRQNIMAAVRDRRRRTQQAQTLLRRFQLDTVADLRPAQLSGGQQQRCALARILASEPGAILLDEPFSALDSYLKAQLELELSQTLEVFSGPVIWVSHDQGEVFRNCRRVCVMDRGRSQAPDTLEHLFRCPGTEAAARLCGCRNFSDARPEGNSVLLPQWGLRLACGRPVPPSLRRIGIRPQQLRPSGKDLPNAFSCSVERVVEDLNTSIVLLRPRDALEDSPLLRMELPRDQWLALGAPQSLAVTVDPNDILFLQDL